VDLIVDVDRECDVVIPTIYRFLARQCFHGVNAFGFFAIVSSASLVYALSDRCIRTAAALIFSRSSFVMETARIDGRGGRFGLVRRFMVLGSRLGYGEQTSCGADHSSGSIAAYFLCPVNGVRKAKRGTFGAIARVVTESAGNEVMCVCFHGVVG
jgi:hypothetical protein